MAIGSNLGITLPVQGSNIGTWGADLNTELQKLIDAVQDQVPVTAIDFSTNMDFNGYAGLDASAYAFEQQASDPVFLNSLFFRDDGQLYIRDGFNNVVQITAAGGINASLLGGFGNSGGTYGTGGITVDWDATAYNVIGNGGEYGQFRLGELKVRDNTGASDVTIVAPALAADYTLKLPPTLVNNKMLTTNFIGDLQFDNSIDSLFVDGITTLIGALSMQSGNDIFLGLNSEITLQTGRVKEFRDRELLIHGNQFVSQAAGINPGAAGAGYTTDALPKTGYYPIHIEEGKQIKEVQVVLDGNQMGEVIMEIRENKLSGFTWTTSVVATTTISGASMLGQGSWTVTPSSPLDVNTGDFYQVSVSTGFTGNAGITVLGIRVIYTDLP